MTLIRVNRPVMTLEHHHLRDHIPEINRLGELGIKWRRLGGAAMTLLERGEYQRVIEMRYANLASVDPGEVACTLNNNTLATLPNGKERVASKIYDARFLGKGRFLSIAYMLDSEILEQERQIVTEELDRMNGVNGYWREFDPHLTVATIEPQNATDDVLQAFYDISPEEITLLPPIANVL